MAGRLILLCGLPGTGKTTVAKELEAGGAVRLSPDEWMTDLGFDLYDTVARDRVEALQWRWAQALVERGSTVVCEAGFWHRWERDERRVWAREHGAPVELRFLDAPVAELQARIVERNRSLPEGHTRVDPAHLVEWDELIERPDADELALFDPPTT